MKLPRILIADDDEDVRALIEELLHKKLQCIFETAPDGATVLEKIKKGRFDLVLLDVMMPGLSGIDVIKKVLKLSPRTKIVVISAYDSQDVSGRALEAGASDYIIKSFLKEEIETKIKRILIKPADSSCKK